MTTANNVAIRLATNLFCLRTKNAKLSTKKFSNVFSMPTHTKRILRFAKRPRICLMDLFYTTLLIGIAQFLEEPFRATGITDPLLKGYSK